MLNKEEIVDEDLRQIRLSLLQQSLDQITDPLIKTRVAKLVTIMERCVNPYPERFERSHTLAQVRAMGDDLKAQIEEAKQQAEADGTEFVKPTGPVVAVAGRMGRKAVMGKLIFADVRNIGGRLQVSIERDKLHEEKDESRTEFKFFKAVTDVGDFIGVKGPLYFTRKGELTVDVREWTFLGKSMRPMPERWAGLRNQEVAWRRRYLDLIANEAARDRFRARSKIVKTIRNFLDDHDFDEVETPVLCTSASGALARPFVAHHNSLDMPVYMRIAPETYLKRLIVGGFDRVYEFARCFRNEGMDPSHLQDFTMLEYYAAYWNYEDNMDFTQRLIQDVIQQVKGSLKFEYQGTELDFSGDWPRHAMSDLIKEHSGIDINAHADRESLLAAMSEKNIHIENPNVGRGNIIDQLYKKTVRPNLIQPMFLTQHPRDLSPLARSNDQNPDFVDRFQLVVNTWEIVNAYSELVDPIDQRQRLEDQAAQQAEGDDEAMSMDEDYLMAMEYGMPPISGWGMGIDRFTALLTNADNLRDTVFFPIMRPLANPSEMNDEDEAEGDE